MTAEHHTENRQRGNKETKHKKADRASVGVWLLVCVIHKQY